MDELTKKTLTRTTVTYAFFEVGVPLLSVILSSLGSTFGRLSELVLGLVPFPHISVFIFFVLQFEIDSLLFPIIIVAAGYPLALGFGYLFRNAIVRFSAGKIWLTYILTTLAWVIPLFVIQLIALVLYIPGIF